MILIKCQYVTKQFSANVYLIDRFSAHLQKSNKPQANHDWFFIHYDKLVDYKGFGFKAQFPNQVKFSKNSAHDFIHYLTMFKFKWFTIQKRNLKMYSTSCPTTHYNITVFECWCSGFKQLNTSIRKYNIAVKWKHCIYNTFSGVIKSIHKSWLKVVKCESEERKHCKSE